MFRESSIKTFGQRIAAMFAAFNRGIADYRTVNPLFAGDYIRVRRTARSPMPGQMGRVMTVSSNDPLGPYLVEFENGMRFRYRHSELERVAYSSSIPAPPIQCHQ